LYCIIQDFLQWVRNTWRKNNQTPKSTPKQYKLSDLLWWLRRDVVLKEISNIMGLEKVDTNTPGWFEHRMLATQKILDNMMDDEKKELRRKGEEMRKNGMPEELQRK